MNITGYTAQSQSGVTVMDGQFVPQIFVDAVQAGFPGLRALYGTRAAVINTNMPYGNDWIGKAITIPYFNLISELSDIDQAGNIVDGGALTPTMLTSFGSTAAVRHSGGAVEWSKWAQSNPIDPYSEGARQLNIATQRRCDKALIDVCSANVSNQWDPYTTDKSSAALTKNIFQYDYITTSRAQLGDYGLNTKPCALVVHSKIAADLYNTKDAIGRPLLIQGTSSQQAMTDSRDRIPSEGDLMLLNPLNIPVIVSDRLPVVAATSSVAAKYKSLLLWEGACVFWMNGTPLFIPWMNPAIPSNQVYIHMYWAAHRYTNISGAPVPGVTHIVTNAQNG
jgi:hypothetical protein